MSEYAQGRKAAIREITRWLRSLTVTETPSRIADEIEDLEAERASEASMLERISVAIARYDSCEWDVFKTIRAIRRILERTPTPAVEPEDG